MLAWRWSNNAEICCHNIIQIFIHFCVWTVILKHFVILLNFLTSWLITNSLRRTGTMELVLRLKMENNTLFVISEIWNVEIQEMCVAFDYLTVRHIDDIPSPILTLSLQQIWNTLFKERILLQNQNDNQSFPLSTKEARGNDSNGAKLMHYRLVLN